MTTKDMIELTGRALDAVAGGRQGRGADDVVPEPPHVEPPGDKHKQKGR